MQYSYRWTYTFFLSLYTPVGSSIEVRAPATEEVIFLTARYGGIVLLLLLLLLYYLHVSYSFYCLRDMYMYIDE